MLLLSYFATDIVLKIVVVGIIIAFAAVDALAAAQVGNSTLEHTNQITYITLQMSQSCSIIIACSLAATAATTATATTTTTTTATATTAAAAAAADAPATVSLPLP